MSAKEFRAKYGGDFQYCYRMGRANRVIVAKENRNFITYINDGVYGQAVPKVNVVLKKKCLYALRDIEAGEELLLDYGFYYVWG
jgi:SET domain-containing protein